MKIQLLKKYLHHDMRQLTHRYGIARFNEDEERKTNAQMGQDTSDEELMQRFCHTGAGYLKRFLQKYIEVDATDHDDTLSQDESWEFTFKKEVSADGDALAELMHWFVVKWAVWQWAQVFDPSNAPLAKAELEDLESSLRSSLRRASMPIKVYRPEPHIHSTEITFTYEPNE